MFGAPTFGGSTFGGRLPSSGLAPQVIALGLAAESDVALPFGLTRALGLAIETDSALPIGRRLIRLLGLAAEADSALPIGGGSGSGLDYAFAASARGSAVRAESTVGAAVRADTSIVLSYATSPRVTESS